MCYNDFMSFFKPAPKLTEDNHLQSLPYSTPRAIVASVSNIRTGDRQQVQQESLIRRNNSWQDLAWEYYDLIGEVAIAANLIASTASRIRLYVGYIDDETVDPVPVKDASILPAELKTAARDALERLTNNTPGGLPGLIRSMALNLFIAGDGYFVQDRSSFPKEEWTFQSVSSLKFSDKRVSLIGYPGQPLTQQHTLPPNDFFARIYRPHPRYPLLADSSLRPTLDSCEELLLLARSARSTIKSRLNAGLLLLPDEILDAKEQGDHTDNQPDLAQDLFDAFSRPIYNEDDPSSAVPTFLTGPAAHLNNIKFLTVSRAFDEKHQEQLERVLDRILASLDIPKDVVAGIGDLKYANATAVEESLFQNHVQPLILAICDALTTAYLRKVLEANGFRGDPFLNRLVVWYDPSAIAARPDRETSSRTGLENDVISAQAWRKANGYSENDAPTQTELAQKLAIKRGTLSDAVTESILRTLIPDILDRIQAQDLSQSGDTPEILQQLQAPEQLDLLNPS